MENVSYDVPMFFDGHFGSALRLGVDPSGR